MDEPAKKAALRAIPYALYLVGAREAEVGGPADLNAFVASWVAQCSFKPPRITIGIRSDSRSNGMIRRSGVFTVNLLGEDQKEIAQRFFRDVTPDERAMHGLPYVVGATGAPLFPDLPASLECRVVETIDHGGDHTVFIGEVVEAHARASEIRPLTHAATGWAYGG